MTYLVTVTSKRQMTIPAELYRRFLLREGQRLWLREVKDGVMMQPVEDLVEKGFAMLSGKTTKRVVDLEGAIEKAQRKYVLNKWREQ